MGARPGREDSALNKRTILISVIVIVCILTLVATVRSFFLKPSDKTRVSPIPEGEYDPAAWGRYYPLQYKSFQKNLQMSASPTDFGGSVKFQQSRL